MFCLFFVYFVYLFWKFQLEIKTLCTEIILEFLEIKWEALKKRIRYASRKYSSDLVALRTATTKLAQERYDSCVSEWIHLIF